MSRYQFRIAAPYLGRLMSLTRRPIENADSSTLLLLRLEFEIFTLDEGGKVGRSTGKIASRDLIIGGPIDSGIQCYAAALRIDEPSSEDSWQSDKLVGRWVTIEFSDVDPTDFRNPFQSIDRRDELPEELVEYDYSMSQEWYSVSEVADDLGVSGATIRRKLVELESRWGTRLVRRTDGGHRRICLPLLRNIF